MNLPHGLQLETACVLIAFRELFDDPNWYDAGIVDNMRTSGDGSFSGHPYDVCERLGLYVPAEFFLPMQNGNLPYITMHVNSQRIRIPRQSKCVWFHKTDTGNHAVCTTVNHWLQGFKHFSPWFTAFHPWGIIIDAL